MSSTDSGTDIELLFEGPEFLEMQRNELRGCEGLEQWQGLSIAPPAAPQDQNIEFATDLDDFASLADSPSPAGPQAVTAQQTLQSVAGQANPPPLPAACHRFPTALTGPNIRSTVLASAWAPSPAPAAAPALAPTGTLHMDQMQYVLTHARPPAPLSANPVTSPVQPPGDRFVEAAVNNAIPALERWPGQHGFRVTVCTPPPAQGGRQQPYVFDSEARKLYVDMDIAVPFAFRVDEGTDVGRLRVAALPVYPEMHHVNTPVRRCPTHRQPELDLNAGAEGHIDHVIRAEHEDAVYWEAGNTKERRSVVVPYERPQPGTEEYKVLYKFCCMNTCVGGINRRRLVIVFTLENSTGEPLGRQTIEVKVCKCPHRDSRTDQTRRRPGQLPPPRPSKRRLEPNCEPSEPATRRPRTGQQLAVLADDQDMYDHLVAVRDSYRIIRRRQQARAAALAAATEDVAAEEIIVDVTPPDVRRRPTLPPVKMEF